MDEFRFELRVCRWAERGWPPDEATVSDGRAGAPVVIARQLGTERRRWDTVVVECDPEGLRARAQFGRRALDRDLLRVVRHAPADWAWYRDAIPEPDFPWRYVREAVDRAADRGVLERRRRSNRVEIRRRFPYPEWVRRVVAVENKPDLDASAARRLREQVEHDVALGLADEVWVATRPTGDRVEPALLEDLPVEVGILLFDDRDGGNGGDDVTEDGEDGDPADATGDGDPQEADAGRPRRPSAGGRALTADVAVAWRPRRLPRETGVRILDRPEGGAHDRSVARFEYVSAGQKRRDRLAIAERAYERGWRSYVDTMRPDCRRFDLVEADGALLPACRAKGRQSVGECAGSCPEFEPEPPAWRRRGWPVEGGPGSLVRELLAERRRRRRPGLDG